MKLVRMDNQVRGLSAQKLKILKHDILNNDKLVHKRGKIIWSFSKRPDAKPMIYAYEDSNPGIQGLVKMVIQQWMLNNGWQQYPTKDPMEKSLYKIF